MFTIVLECRGSDRITLAYQQVSLHQILDIAIWLANINDLPLSEINIRFVAMVVTQSTTTALTTHVTDDF
jgi:hypothetical protein